MNIDIFEGNEMNTFDEFEHGGIFFENQVSGVATVVQDHVRLPIFGRYTSIDTPPEILFGFASPSENRETYPNPK